MTTMNTPRRILHADVYDALELSALAEGGIGAGQYFEEYVPSSAPFCAVGRAVALGAPFCAVGHVMALGGEAWRNGHRAAVGNTPENEIDEFLRPLFRNRNIVSASDAAVRAINTRKDASTGDETAKRYLPKLNDLLDRLTATDPYAE